MDISKLNELIYNLRWLSLQEWFDLIAWWHFIPLGILGLCVIIQLYYTFRYFGKTIKHKDAVPGKAILQPVSVVVCVQDRPESVNKLIQALLAQDYPQYEIVIVDDRSDEEHYYALLNLSKSIPKIHVTRIEETPDRFNAKKFALTMGIKAAKNELIIFTDDDCLPNSNQWIKKMVAGFDRGKDLVLGYSPYSKYPGLLNALIRYETFYTAVQYLGIALAGRPYMGVGRNLAYKRSMFFAYKGFYQHIFVHGGDDDLFVNRTANSANTSVCIDKDSQVVSEPKHSYKDWLKQKRRHLRVSKLYKYEDKQRLGVLGLSYVWFWFFGLISLCTPLMPAAFLLITIRQLVYGLTLKKVAKRLGEPFGFFEIIKLDFFYVFLQTRFSIGAMFSKNQGW